MDDLGPDPVGVFVEWYKQAIASADPFPDAMTLATVDENGRPSARVVLYKGVIEGGIGFFTNYESDKARQLEAFPWAALVFHWTSLRRQVRISGPVHRLSAEASDLYFQSRPRESQLGAWASPQSRAVRSREALDALYAEQAERFEGESVPRPQFWGGYCLVPQEVEFWIGRDYRLHDRFGYKLGDSGWTAERLAP
jgi:pyridoxamine 5'-phosphate oxidase